MSTDQHKQDLSPIKETASPIMSTHRENIGREDILKQQQQNIMKSQEQELRAKLGSKYSNLGKTGLQQSLIQKRLSNRQKYFDSGDYNMTKDLAKKKHLPANQQNIAIAQSTGHEIPQPEAIPHRKPSVSSTQATNPLLAQQTPGSMSNSMYLRSVSTPSGIGIANKPGAGLSTSCGQSHLQRMSMSNVGGERQSSLATSGAAFIKSTGDIIKEKALPIHPTTTNQHNPTSISNDET